MAGKLPDITVLDTEGREVNLRDIVADRPLILAYVRHYG